MSFVSIARGFSSLIAGLFLGGTALADDNKIEQQTVEREQGNVYGFSQSEAIQAATLAARETLPVFKAMLASYPDHPQDFGLKVRLSNDDGEVEHIWAYAISFPSDNDKGGLIQAKLANTPLKIAGLDVHSSISFTEDDVSDWLIMDGGKQYGAFITRAMLNLVDEETAVEMEKTLHPDPIAPQWLAD